MLFRSLSRIERGTSKPGVAGSIPARRANTKNKEPEIHRYRALRFGLDEVYAPSFANCFETIAPNFEVGVNWAKPSVGYLPGQVKAW